MTEYEGVCLLLSPATEIGEYLPSPFDGVYIPCYYDTGDRLRDPAGSVLLAPLVGLFDSWIPGPVALSAVAVHPAPSLQMGHVIGANKFTGILNLFDGMFSSRDKLARIGVVCTITGIPLGNTDVILNGINHREIVKTDKRGVWWKYLEIDEYPDALFISPNGIVYALLEQKERVDNEGIFDQTVQRRTIANVTSRQFHRKFV